MPDDMPTLPEVDALKGKTFLVCLGAAKCGTSWLHNYLDSLSDMTVSPLKELHFFNAKFAGLAMGDMQALAIKRLALHLNREGDLVDTLTHSPDFQASLDAVQMIYDESAYFAHFARLARSETRAFCDITPGYSVLGPNGMDYMAKIFATQPELRLRLLLILRDPVDRLWSQLRHLEEINPKSVATKRWENALKSQPIMGRCDYAGTVSDLDMTFGADQVCYVFYEDLFAEETLRDLCDFVGVEYRPGAVSERQNKSAVTADLPDAAREAFRAALDGQYAFCRERFGPRIPASWAG